MFHENLTSITSSLHEDQYKFLVLFLSFLLIIGKVPDESYRENPNAHFVFSNFFSENYAFMR
jgi:hypothetical protein